MTSRILTALAAASLGLAAVAPAHAMSREEMDSAMMMISGGLFTELTVAGIDTSKMASLTLGEIAQVMQLLEDDENRSANLAQIQKLLDE